MSIVKQYHKDTDTTKMPENEYDINIKSSRRRKSCEDTRQCHIDVLKSLAIFMVISYHTSSWMNVDDFGLHFLIRYYFRTILSCCVPLFFFINGCLLLNRELDVKKHIIRTVRYIALTFIWAALDLFVLMFVRNDYLSVKEFIKGVWTWKFGWIHYFWYMPALINSVCSETNSADSY